MITTTLNDQNHISKNCIGSVIFIFILTEVPFVYMKRAGFMTCTAASHQGAIKEPAASLWRMSETHPIGISISPDMHTFGLKALMEAVQWCLHVTACLGLSTARDGKKEWRRGPTHNSLCRKNIFNRLTESYYAYWTVLVAVHGYFCVVINCQFKVKFTIFDHG